MSNIQNVQTQIPTTIATQTGQGDGFKTTAAKEPAPLLGGESVTVSQPMSDLEKLVARLKVENDDRKTSLVKQHLSSVLDAYTARYGELSAKQSEILVSIAANNESISSLTGELEGAQKELSSAQADSAVMQAKIDSLERAVEQAVEDGKIHRENVAKLKEQLAEDVENEDLQAELAEEEAALELAEKTISKNEADLASAQAAAGSLSAKIESLSGKVASLKSQISSLEDNNAELAGQLDSKTVGNLLALFAAEEKPDAPERSNSPAEEKKAEKKEIANDPARILREAMDRMDEEILRDIDANRDRSV